MPAVKSNYLRGKLKDHVLRNVAFTPPTVLGLRLYTVMPALDGTGGTQVTGGSYAPQPVAFSASWVNSAMVTFSNMPGVTIVGGALFDTVASSGGNMLYAEEFTTPLTVTAGNNVSFNPGDISIDEI
jgi:hypothetical protein